MCSYVDGRFWWCKLTKYINSFQVEIYEALSFACKSHTLGNMKGFTKDLASKLFTILMLLLYSPFICVLRY